MVDRFVSKFYSGIRFADYVFSEPIPLAICVTEPQRMGVYAVLVPDATWGPRHFQPIFFGVFNGHHQSQLSPDDYRRCLRAAAGKLLYVAAYNMPLVGDPSESQRIQRELVQIYSPLCNHDSADASSAELVRKLDALEMKNQEHEALLKVLLAALGHLVQPTHEIKKRAVGFQTGSAASRHSAPPKGECRNLYWNW